MSIAFKTVCDTISWGMSLYTTYSEGKQAYNAYQRGENLECALHAVVAVGAGASVVSQSLAAIEKEDAEMLKEPLNEWMQEHTDYGLEGSSCLCGVDPEGAEIAGMLFEEVNSLEASHAMLTDIQQNALIVRSTVGLLHKVKNILF